MKISGIEPFVRQVVTVMLRETTHYEVYNELRAPDCRLFYSVNGSGSIVTEGEIWNLKPRCAVLVGAGSRYVWQPAAGEPMQFISVNFDYTQNFCHIRQSFHPVHADDFSDDAVLEHIRFEDAPALSAPVVLYEAGAIEGMLRMLSTEYYIESDLRDALLSSLMKSILLTIVRAAGENPTAGSSKGSVLTRSIINYIQNHYRENITNERIAELFHFDSSYINRVFRKHTGVSLHAFLVDYRLNMAMDLLRTQNTAVSDIAAEVDFSDPVHFTKSFRKHTGITPTEFIKARR